MISGRIAVGAALAVVLATTLVQSGELARATTFNPRFSSPVTFSDTTPGGNPDITIPFDIPPPSALGGAINFGDPALTTASDAQIPAAPTSAASTLWPSSASPMRDALRTLPWTSISSMRTPRRPPCP